MVRPTQFSALSAVLLMLALPAALEARPGRVVTKDGKTFEGDVTEHPNEKKVDVVIEGRKYTFSTANLARKIEYDNSIIVQTAPPPARPQPDQGQPGQPPARGPIEGAEQEFAKRRAALAANDAAGRVRLARWAFERKEYDLARDVAEEAVTLDRRNQEAQEMLRTIDAQRRLNNKPPSGQPSGQPAVRPPATKAPAIGAPTPGPAGNGLVPPLMPDEVNLVRLLEWRGEKGVRIRLLNDVKRRFLARSDIRPAEFNRMNAVEQAEIMKEKGGRDLWNDIRMTNDPPSMREYRTQIQRTVLEGCATAACHGGGAGSDRFALHPRAEQDAEAYANFITLHKYQYKPKNGPEAAMIDRNRPEDSLVVQFGLAPTAANIPHPEVEGFRPIFRTPNDAKLKTLVRWLNDFMTPMRNDYGVPFDAQEDEEAEAPAMEAQAPVPPANPTGTAPPGGPPGRNAPPGAVGRPLPPQRPAPPPR